MLVKFIISQKDKLQIETFDIDIDKNRIWKIDVASRSSYLRNLNEFILRDIYSRRIIPE